MFDRYVVSVGFVVAVLGGLLSGLLDHSELIAGVTIVSVVPLSVVIGGYLRRRDSGMRRE